MRTSNSRARTSWPFLLVGAVAFTLSCQAPVSQECEGTGLICPPETKCSVEGDACITGLCGDGTTQEEAGENCDDGNLAPGDGCGPTCVLEECGNGILDPGEVCEKSLTVACREDCMSDLSCGNTIIDTEVFEACDDGPSRFVNGKPVGGDGCSADCKSNETCGNEIIDDSLGETCDPPDGKSCSKECHLCGNGIEEDGEVCDDENNQNGDGCNATCTSDETCGNGTRDRQRPDDENGDPVPPEVCDDGNNKPGDGCSTDCLSEEFCGNGVRDKARPPDENGKARPEEICDDGNNKPGDGCNADCSSTEECGNGVVDKQRPPKKDGSPQGPEACDDGNLTDGDGCSSKCLLEACGNGVVDEGEECDDGNTVGGDGCSALCDSDETCGNGVRDEIRSDEMGMPLPPEACDDLNNRSGDGCSADCSSDESCGNGIQDLVRPPDRDGTPQPAEVCDDGNTKDDDGCSSDCRSLESCGNGVVDPGEDCDEGPPDSGASDQAAPSDTCNANCKFSECGDGIVNAEAGEDCDKRGVNTVTCNANCTNAVCGDGYVNSSNEQCDPGEIGRDTATCNKDCSTARCGDRYTNSIAGEDCDTGGDSESCDADCTDVKCGDGYVNHTKEDCDSGQTFSGNAIATAACNDDCTAVRCGDGKPNEAAGEECDPGPNNTAGCYRCKRAFCGDGIVNPNFETCDGGDADHDGAADDTVECNGARAAEVLAPDGTSLQCQFSRCGDGYANRVAEECYPGTVSADGQTCSEECLWNECGDGNVLGSEECDNGNKDTADCNGRDAGLRACMSSECGDGYINSAGEDCEVGQDGKDVVSPIPCNGRDAGSQKCQTPYCGDGYTHKSECCDINDSSKPCDFSKCDPDCTYLECGDGYLNEEGLEECEPTQASSMAPAVCDNNCKIVECGNGILQGAEVCEPSLDSKCTDACLFNKCGDGYPKESEECDLGEHNTALCNGAGGVAPCQKPSCGDGRINAAFGEECDSLADVAGCNGKDANNGRACKLSFCGDKHCNSADETSLDCPADCQKLDAGL